LKSGIDNMLEHEVVDTRWQDSSSAGMTDRLVWYVNRLRCMTPAEIRHRLLRAVGMQAERWGLLGSAAVPPPDIARVSRPWILAPGQVNAAPYLKAADRIVAGRLCEYLEANVKGAMTLPFTARRGGAR
jgi:hypothetical protein